MYKSLYKHDSYALIIVFNCGTYKEEVYCDKHFFKRQDLPEQCALKINQCNDQFKKS